MNDTILTGPCAEYEHDLVELLDGSLGPERSRVIRLHVDACPRCRAWQAEFAAFEGRLGAALPRPELPADFEHRLHERLAAAARPARRHVLRSAVDGEYERLIDAIGRGARRHLLLDAIGSVAATVCLLFAARGLLGPGGALLASVEGPQHEFVLGVIGAGIAAAALAWSAARGALPMAGLRR